MLKGAYRRADVVTIDMRRNPEMSDEDARMVARGILSGIVHVIVGASPDIQEAIVGLKDGMAPPPSP